jgi:hypothetical protein
MNTVVRDVVIFVGVLIALRVVSRVRSGRQRRASGALPTDPGGDGTNGAAADDLTGYASAHGWVGPSDDLSSEQLAVDYAETMLRNLFGAAGTGSEVRVSGPRFEELYSGRSAGRPFLIGNARLGVAGTEHVGSICVLHLGEMLPPLFVNLRRYHPYVRLLMKEMTFESDAFNRRFSVLAVDREYAMDVISERSMEILMERDDWVFALEFDRMVCLTRSSLSSAKDYADRLDAVTRFCDLIPRFVEQDMGLEMPALPDGTVLDPADRASRERFKEAFLAMAPAQQEQAIGEMRERGAKFLVGMLGSRVTPDLAAHLEQRLATAQDPDVTGSDPWPAPSS